MPWPNAQTASFVFGCIVIISIINPVIYFLCSGADSLRVATRYEITAELADSCGVLRGLFEKKALSWGASGCELWQRLKDLNRKKAASIKLQAARRRH